MAKEVIEIEVKSDIGNVTKDLKDVSKGAKESKKEVGGISKAFKGMGTAIKAAGIGLVVSLLAKLMEVFSKNQKVLDTFNTAMTALSIAFNDLFNYLGENIGNITGYFKSIFDDPVQSLKDFGTAIKENIVERFASMLDTVGLVASAIGKLIKRDFKGAMEDAKEAGKELVDTVTGVDGSFDKITETVKSASAAVTKYTKATIKQAAAIVETAKAAESAGVIQEALNKKFAKDALIQQQIIDNELLSFDKRQEALKELTRLTEENNKSNLASAQIREKAAQDAFNLNESDANFIALQEEKNAVMDITASNLAAENALFDTKILLNNQYNENLLENADEELKIAKVTADGKKAIQDANLSNMASGVSLIKSLAGENKAVMAASLIAENAVGIAKNIIDTNAANARLTLEGGVFAPALIAANFTRMGIGIAASVAATAQGLSALGEGGGGGGGASSSSSGSSSVPAPQMMSGAFDISGGVAPEPVEAFVLTDSMTNSQNQLANIRRRATI